MSFNMLTGVQFPAQARDFTFLTNEQTSSGTLLASYSVSSECVFTGATVGDTWSWLMMSNFGRAGWWWELEFYATYTPSWCAKRQIYILILLYFVIYYLPKHKDINSSSTLNMFFSNHPSLQRYKKNNCTYRNFFIACAKMYSDNYTNCNSFWHS